MASIFDPRAGNVVSQLEYFVTDDSGTRGPVSADVLRGALANQAAPVARVRVAGCEPWLPLESWEALADLCPSPDAPPTPSAGPSTQLPRELADIAPVIRESLLWFVADSDGVMGPVSGEFIRRGLTSGKIKMGVGICLVSTNSWVRASIAFPSALEGATAVRPRTFVTFPCPACREPCVASDASCTACDEPIKPPPKTLGTGMMALLVAVAWVIVLALSLGIGLLVRKRALLDHEPAEVPTAVSLAAVGTARGAS